MSYTLLRAACCLALLAGSVSHARRYGPEAAATMAWRVVAGTALHSGRIVGCFSALADPSLASRTPNSDWALSAAARVVASASGGDPVAVRRAAVALSLYGQDLKALSMLTASEARSPSAATLNDIAAVELQAANAEPQTVSTLVDAVDAAVRAVLMGRGERAVGFNLVLALRGLGVPQPPEGSVLRPTFESCLAGPMSSGAAVVVGDAQKTIDRSTRFIERELLPRWAEASRSGGEGASRVAAAEALKAANELGRIAQDRFVPALAVQLSEQSSHRTTMDRLNAWNAYVEALTLADEELDGRAAVRLREARTLASGASGPLDAAIQLEYAAVLRREGQSLTARSVLIGLLGNPETLSFLRIRGRANWQLGLLLEEAGLFGAALGPYRAAESILATAADLEGLALVKMRLARFHAQLSEFTTAWRYGSQALQLAPFASRVRRDAIARGAAAMASAQGLDAAALAFQDTPLMEARQAASQSGLAFLLSDRARQLHRLGFTAQAVDALAEAESHEGMIESTGVAEMARAIRLRAEAGMAEESDPTRAVYLLGEVSEIYRTRGDDFATAEVELLRARALRRLGRLRAALDSLDAGTSALIRKTRSIASSTSRARVAAAAWPLYRELADIRLQLSGPRAAFDALEQGRRFGVASPAPATIGIAPGVAAVGYVVLPAGAFGIVRVLSKERVFQLDWGTGRLIEAISRLTDNSLSLSDPEANRIRRELFDVLLGPIEQELRVCTRLVVVPDTALERLPFAALLRPSGEAVVATHTVSLSTELAPSRRVFSRFSAPKRILSIGVSEGGETLPPLPLSIPEATTVASLYSKPTTLLGGDGTRDAFISALSGAEVVHFAGHAVHNPHDPTLSRLILSPSARDELGAVFESDIAYLNGSAARLVVLAACSTAVSVESSGAAAFGLSRAFLRAGSEFVIGTLAPVPDRAVSEVFVEIHRGIVKGLLPDEALRIAQLAAARSGLGWRQWGRIVVIREGTVSVRSTRGGDN